MSGAVGQRSNDARDHVFEGPQQRDRRGLSAEHDGPEIVRITFVANGGYRSRVGTVPPLSTESFDPRVNGNVGDYWLIDTHTR